MKIFIVLDKVWNQLFDRMYSITPSRMPMLIIPTPKLFLFSLSFASLERDVPRAWPGLKTIPVAYHQAGKEVSPNLKGLRPSRVLGRSLGQDLYLLVVETVVWKIPAYSLSVSKHQPERLSIFCNPLR